MARPPSIAIGPPDVVDVRWSDGASHRHRARDLRLACPCAHCIHEFTRRPLLDPATVPADLACLDSTRIGNYATRFLWSDGHSSGLYTNDLLRRLGAATADGPETG